MEGRQPGVGPTLVPGLLSVAGTSSVCGMNLRLSLSLGTLCLSLKHRRKVELCPCSFVLAQANKSAGQAQGTVREYHGKLLVYHFVQRSKSVLAK